MTPEPASAADFYDRWADSRPRFARFGRYYLAELAQFYRRNIPRDARILEVGCGQGDLLGRLSPAAGSLGVDASPRMIAAARRRWPSLAFAVADAQVLDLSGTFDAVIASDLVGDLDDVQAFFRSARTVLSPRGRLFVDFFNPWWEPLLLAAERLGLRMPRRPQNWLPFGAVESIAALEGFEVVRATHAVLCPVRVPVLSAILNRFVAKCPGVARLCLLHRVVLRRRPEAVSAPPPAVSVVVPCRNERGNIEPLVRRLPAMGSRTQIVFVDGDSSDGTVEEIERMRRAYPDRDIVLVRQEGAGGKGDAVRRGFAVASGDVLMILDADLTVPPEDLPKFYDVIASGLAEFVNGTRRVYPMDGDAMRIINRIGNRFFSAVFRWLLDQRITDTLCGTKVLWAEDWRRILEIRQREFGDQDPFGDFDLIFGAARLNLKILEVPIRYRARTYGETKIRRFRHGWMLAKMCVTGFWRLKRI